MNSVNIIGNVGQPPEYKIFDSGKKVVRLSIGVNGFSNAKDGEGEPLPMWVTCEAWDNIVDRLQQCEVRKGTRIAVTGSLAQNVYTNEEGRRIRKHFLKMYNFTVLTKKGEKPDESEEVKEVA